MLTSLKPSYRLNKPQEIILTKEEIRTYNEITSFVKQIDEFIVPKVHLEQYSLPCDLIALILLLSEKDLMKKNVVDLGCGTGRLTLPVKKFYASTVLGVEIDSKSVKVLTDFIKLYKLDVELLITAIEFLEPDNWKKKYETTIMNPPFGTKRRKIDFIFLEQALKYSNTVISIHKSNSRTRKLIEKLGSENGKEMIIIATVEFPIYPSFKFHRKKEHFVCIDIIRLGN
jgi:putative methylase